MLAQSMNFLWSVLSVVAEFLVAALAVSLFVPKMRESGFVRFFRKNGLLVAFVVSLLATTGSLIYSDVIGYAPCKLCWFQRIFMYPQVLLMGIALWKKDQNMKLYGFVMSVVGAAIALYHYVGQLGLTSLPCSALGVSVSCSVRFVMNFGYVTIPMMAFSAFALIAVALWVSMKSAQSESHDAA